jgi:hypothetical protein
MKKILWLLLIMLLLFIGLVYWSVSVVKKGENKVVIFGLEESENIDFKKKDSVLIAASGFYKGNFVKNAMQGKNYRAAWSTPVMVPVVFLDTLFGGMEIVDEGGGSQTHSLKLRSPEGIMYSLRSINKFPESHVPGILKTLGLENIVTDGISAMHPYGAVAAAALAEAAGILHTNPIPMFIPKQEILGDYNEKFGNRLFLLEKETEGDVNWTPFKNVLSIMETDDLQELKKQLGDTLSIDKEAFVMARLFDLLIGDWDRHSEQWGWVVKKEDDKLIAHPLPGDRDNVFFKLKGFIPNIISNKNIEPLVRPFENNIDYLPGLVYPVDRYFLFNTPEAVFRKVAKDLQQKLTDEKIEKALKVWPDKLYELNAEEIATKIKNRRDRLEQYAVAFRKIIQEKGLLEKPLKGSEDLQLSPGLMKCFECKD